MINDLFQVMFINLKHRKLRTWLTIIGIVIGISAIVSLISISSGLENAITDQFEQMGTNRVFVQPKGLASNFNVEGIDEDDNELIKSMSEVEWTSSYIYASREAKYGRKTAFIQNLIGFDTEKTEEKFESYGMGLEKGRYFKDRERRVMLVGYRAVEDLFDKEMKIGSKITISSIDFTVIGVISEVGNPDDDNNVYIPMEDARILANEPEKLMMIDVSLKEGVDIQEVANKITRELKRTKDHENFEVSTPEQLLEQVGDILNILTIVLGGIAAISLMVGGVGIMNSTYTSVLERTKEIGIMKSLGAKNKDVLKLFILESGFLGLIGGIIGTALGVLISIGMGAAMSQAGFGMIKINFDWRLWVFSLAFAFLVGVISGYFPAKKASEMKPVDAMRV